MMEANCQSCGWIGSAEDVKRWKSWSYEGKCPGCGDMRSLRRRPSYDGDVVIDEERTELSDDDKATVRRWARQTAALADAFTDERAVKCREASKLLFEVTR